jgi:arabinose-5-phosphate isomerase
VIGISSNVNSELIKSSTISLIIPSSKEACSIGLAPTTSTTMALVIGDALCVSLMKLKKFKVSDYKKYHPGGALGMQLIQVKEVMHTKSKMPIVRDNASMKTVVIEMTKKSFGHVGVIDNKKQLIGIITDGDLRRNINKQFFKYNASTIMSSKPKLISKDSLVLDALSIMNNNKITCLFVVEKTKEKSPIGIVHIHDCLRYAN